MNYPDCLIVGAGITGLVSALELARRGHRVAVVDGKAPAVVLQEAEGEVFRLGAQYGDPLDELRRKSLDAYSRLLEAQPGACAWPSTPELHVVTRDEDVARSRSWCDGLRRERIAAEFLAPEALVAFDPALQGDVPGGVLLPAAPLVESAAFHQSLMDACARAAIAIHWNTPVFGLSVENGRAVAVRTQRGALPADAILVTAGIGAIGFIAAVGLQLPIVPERCHILPASPVASGTPRAVTVFCGSPGDILGVRGGSEGAMWVLLRPERESVVTGGRSFAWSRGASHRLAVESLRQNFAVLLPGHAHLLSGRVASRVRACIVDGLPVIGPASTIDNLYFGLHRSDFRGMLAPAVGLLSAQAVAARQVSDPATPYSMERFPQSAPGGQRRVKD